LNIVFSTFVKSFSSSYDTAATATTSVDFGGTCATATSTATDK
jgi:hypothetical protein